MHASRLHFHNNRNFYQRGSLILLHPHFLCAIYSSFIELSNVIYVSFYQRFVRAKHSKQFLKIFQLMFNSTCELYFLYCTVQYSNIPSRFLLRILLKKYSWKIQIPIYRRPNLSTYVSLNLYTPRSDRYPRKRLFQV